MSIWTETKSRYGEYTDDVKNVSTSTARRWSKESRTKKRQSIGMKKLTSNTLVLTHG